MLGVVLDLLRFLCAGPPGVSGEENQCSVSGAVFAAHLDVLMMRAGEKGISALTFRIPVWGGGQWLHSNSSSVCHGMCVHQQALRDPQGSAPGSWISGKCSCPSYLSPDFPVIGWETEPLGNPGLSGRQLGEI